MHVLQRVVCSLVDLEQSKMEDLNVMISPLDVVPAVVVRWGKFSEQKQGLKCHA